jgi:ADP-ribose pyrophosphatase
MKVSDLRPWETLSKEVILNPNKFLTVENHVIRLPDGQIIPDWSWLIIPSAVIVLAMTQDGKYLCFRQVKYAVEGITLAPVGGMLEPGEEPLSAAKRELLEETGFMASDWVNFGSYILDPNRGIATIHLFFAMNAYKDREPITDDLEDQLLLFLTRGEIEVAYQAGEFKILSWSTVVAMALNYLSTANKMNNQ